MTAPTLDRPRFAPGDRVRIATASPPGHRRVPSYIRGKTGVVERHTGAYPNPEENAYQLDAPERHVYRVAFSQSDLWANYNGTADDRLYIEIQEHWLIKA